MTYKLTHVDDKEVNLGHFNEAPEGWHEVDEHYVATRTQFHRYSPEYIQYRQILRLADGTKLNGPCRSVTLHFYHDGTGVGLEVDYWGRGHYDTPKGDGKHMIWYAWGCEHSYVDYEVPSGHRSGLHKAKCSKCGRLTEYDTSD